MDEYRWDDEVIISSMFSCSFVFALNFLYGCFDLRVIVFFYTFSFLFSHLKSIDSNVCFVSFCFVEM